MMRYIFTGTQEIQEKTEAALSLVRSKFSVSYVSGLFNKMFDQL